MGKQKDIFTYKLEEKKENIELISHNIVTMIIFGGSSLKGLYFNFDVTVALRSPKISSSMSWTM